MNSADSATWLENRYPGPTGIDCLDGCLPPGGYHNGVYGLLGPIGVGKSTLGAMIAVEGAKKAFACNIAGGQAGAWVYINFDGAERDMVERLVSHGAMISRAEKNRQWFLDDLSEIGQYRQYEHARSNELPHSDGVLLGERERLADFDNEIWKQTLRLLHLASSSLGASLPPAKAIARHLESLTLQRCLDGVVVDYAGLAVANRAGCDGIATARELARFGLECRHLIANRWGCRVWIIHQLNGAANRLAPGALQHHDHARDSRHFADHLDACFVLGTRDRTNHSMLLRCTKSAVELPEPTILEFDHHFATLRPAVGHHVDRFTNRITTGNNIHFDPRLDEFFAGTLHTP